jgi:aromatic-L-amino-acid decarboxylase
MLHGAGAFRDALTEKLMLAAAFHQGLMNLVAKGFPIEIVAFPQLTVIPFRLRQRPTESVHEWNVRNGVFLKAINNKLRCFLSSTTLPSSVGEVHTLRVCVLSYRTHIREIDHCLKDIESAAVDLLIRADISF